MWLGISATKFTTCAITFVTRKVLENPIIKVNNRKTMMTEINLVNLSFLEMNMINGLRISAVNKAVINGMETGKTKIIKIIANTPSIIKVHCFLVILCNK